jgi:hypothetical protein
VDHPGTFFEQLAIAQRTGETGQAQLSLQLPKCL